VHRAGRAQQESGRASDTLDFSSARRSRHDISDDIIASRSRRARGPPRCAFTCNASYTHWVHPHQGGRMQDGAWGLACKGLWPRQGLPPSRRACAQPPGGRRGVAEEPRDPPAPVPASLSGHPRHMRTTRLLHDLSQLAIQKAVALSRYKRTPRRAGGRVNRVGPSREGLAWLGLGCGLFFRAGA
jgi:hypothetical protein